MKYKFICDCGKDKIVIKAMKDPFEDVVCDCGKKMYQDLRSKGRMIKLPETFKAGSEYAPKNYLDGSGDLLDMGY